MNKFKTLTQVSTLLWVLAIILMSINWLRIWTYAFSHTQYLIEDKFIYIGILGGWIFVGIFYLALIILIGNFAIYTIKKIANDAQVSRGEQE